MFQNSYFFQCLSWYLRILSACLSVTVLHNVRIFCAVSQLMLMTWHYKRLTNFRQHAHIEIIYVCERGKFRIFAFKTCYFFHYFCWYFRYFVGMTFNREILGGGGDNTGQRSPTRNIGGGDISPHPTGIDTHVCVSGLESLSIFLPADWGGGGGGAGGTFPYAPPPPIVTPLDMVQCLHVIAMVCWWVRLPLSLFIVFVCALNAKYYCLHSYFNRY